MSVIFGFSGNGRKGWNCGEKVAKGLEANVERYYGTAMPAYLDRMMQGVDRWMEVCQTTIESFRARWRRRIGSPIHLSFVL